MNNDGHVAFKCTYNDGPESPYGIGFFDVCTQENIIRNIENKRIWCCGSECKDYYDGDLEKDELWFPCYESQILSYWRFGAGMFRTGKKSGEPMHMKGVKSGKMAVMTTRIPNSVEEKRKIFAILLIKSIEPATKEDHNMVKFDPYKSIILVKNEWLDFWKYYSTRVGKPLWGTGLFRYLTDNNIEKMLKDVINLDRFKNKSNMAMELLNNIK